MVLDISSVPLLDGTYTMSFSLADRTNADAIAWRDGRDQFRVAEHASQARSRGVVALDISSTLCP